MQWRAELGFATWVSLAACHHAPPHKPGEEWVQSIKFEGNTALPDHELVTGLASHRAQQRGRSVDTYTVSVDRDRILGDYVRHGYLDADVRPRVERSGDAMTLIYTIDEGNRATTRVVITGLPDDVPVANVRTKLRLADGAPFEYTAYENAKLPMLEVVKDAGYAHAILDARVVADRRNRQTVIELDFAPGSKCTFGPGTITGVDGDLREAVEDRLAFDAGDSYSNAAIVKTQRALYGLGRFSTVRVDAAKDPGATVVDVKVAVAEGARHEVMAGGGFGADPLSYEVRGRVGYSIAGWPFPLDTVVLDFRPAYALLRDGTGYQPRLRALARLERADLFWTYTKADVEVGYNYLAVEAYTSYGPHTRLGFSTQLGTPKVSLRVGWGLEYLDFRNLSPLIDPALQMQIGLDHPERIGKFEQALIVDLRDHPIEPHLGVYGELHVAEGTAVAGGAYGYTKVAPELRGFLPIGPVVLAAHARAGAIYGDVPPTERFFAGGATGQRGFSERRLAPMVTGDVNGQVRSIPYGGAAMIETGLEVRFPITSIWKLPLGGVGFLDGGDVTETPSEITPTNLHWALGAGLRLHTIVGPVRFDLGYRLNRTGAMEPEPGTRIAFHLSVGEAF